MDVERGEADATIIILSVRHLAWEPVLNKGVWGAGCWGVGCSGNADPGCARNAAAQRLGGDLQISF